MQRWSGSGGSPRPLKTCKSQQQYGQQRRSHAGAPPRVCKQTQSCDAHLPPQATLAACERKARGWQLVTDGRRTINHAGGERASERGAQTS